ncbi:hypothetical protein J1605_018146 [Eschrichtius robustus]|uniref:Uncharacterized protein n=1 Tax=Eschrichtius robustus TaxID=9764 RepID=A0AB34I0T7_ESCRO|nr:hypothetical protein J1605_018146 [Eschrichtius robustus]
MRPLGVSVSHRKDRKTRTAAGAPKEEMDGRQEKDLEVFRRKKQQMSGVMEGGARSRETWAKGFQVAVWGPGRRWRGQEQHPWRPLHQAGLYASLDSSPVPIPGSKPPSSIHSSCNSGSGGDEGACEGLQNFSAIGKGRHRGLVR